MVRSKLDKEQTNVCESVMKKFSQGGEMELKGKIVYLNKQYRKANFACTSDADFGVKGNLLNWKNELENADFSTPFSYYSKNGEDKVSIVFKVPPAKVDQLMNEYKTVESVIVELKYYQDYPTPGKHGAWLQLKEWK